MPHALHTEVPPGVGDPGFKAFTFAPDGVSGAELLDPPDAVVVDSGDSDRCSISAKSIW